MRFVVSLLTILFVTICLDGIEALRSSKKSSTSQHLELPCSKSSEAEVDVVFGRMSGYGNVSRPYPSTENELQEYCRQVQNFILSKILSYHFLIFHPGTVDNLQTSK